MKKMVDLFTHAVIQSYIFSGTQTLSVDKHKACCQCKLNVRLRHSLNW